MQYFIIRIYIIKNSDEPTKYEQYLAVECLFSSNTHWHSRSKNAATFIYFNDEKLKVIGTVGTKIRQS